MLSKFVSERVTHALLAALFTAGAGLVEAVLNQLAGGGFTVPTAWAWLLPVAGLLGHQLAGALRDAARQQAPPPDAAGVVAPATAPPP